MSIINAITSGGSTSGRSWNFISPTGATSTTLTFSVQYEPSSWAVVFNGSELTHTDTDIEICYIGKVGGTYYEYGIYRASGTYGMTGRGGTPTYSYNSGTFTITADSGHFYPSTTFYKLIYI